MKIVSLEGPDFSGKSTLATSLLMALRKKGLTVERTELPSRLVTGLFTSLLRNSKDEVDKNVFSLIQAADHLHHYNSFKTNNNADVLILERSSLSYFIYQGFILGADIDWLKELNKFNKMLPDITIIPKVPYDELLRRKNIRVGLKDQFEEDVFLKKVTKEYYNLPGWLIKKYNVNYIPFNTAENMNKELIKKVLETLNK